jgi:hypothetical protein
MAERDVVAYTPDGGEICIGLNDGIPSAVYHRLPGVSQSQLKVLRDQSPAHLRWQMDHPTPSSQAQELGAAIHDCVLLPDLFASSYLRGVPGDGRTKAIKEAREAQQLENPGATILKPEDYDTCIAVRDAIAAHPKARALLTGDAEQSALWRDPATGLLCRGRFDLLTNRSRAIVDLKSCQSAAPRDFQRAIWTYGWMVQAAFYIDAAAALGLDYDRFAFCAVEKSPPWGIALYELSLAAIDDGRKLYRPLLETYARCLETDTWPGYSEDVTVIDIPAWGAHQVADELMEGAA